LLTQRDPGGDDPFLSPTRRKTSRSRNAVSQLRNSH
jgi:hypothetical protein